MAWIDNFMASQLKAQIDAKFLPSPGGQVVVSFGALALACQADASLESEVLTAVDTIKTATGWNATIVWNEGVVTFNK